MTLTILTSKVPPRPTSYDLNIHIHTDKDGNIMREDGSDVQLSTREKVNTAAMTRPLKGRPIAPLPGDNEKRIATSRAKTKSKRKDNQKLGDNPEVSFHQPADIISNCCIIIYNVLFL